MRSSRRLFDGHTLAGWRVAPRLPTTPYPGAPAPDPQSEPYVCTSAHPARWSVKEGAIVGEQDVGGRGFGGYLVSEEVFGDFELEIDAWPDWPADTGIMLRATALGSQGFQILVDHRKSGALVGFTASGLAVFMPSATTSTLGTTGPVRRPAWCSKTLPACSNQ
jgi:hypothetical protein